MNPRQKARAAAKDRARLVQQWTNVGLRLGLRGTAARDFGERLAAEGKPVPGHISTL